jgi:hypothetical protein
VVCEFFFLFRIQCEWSLVRIWCLPMWMTVMVVGGSFRMLQVLRVLLACCGVVWDEIAERIVGVLGGRGSTCVDR